MTIAFSPDGREVATGGDDHLAHIWDVSTRQERLRLPHDDRVETVTFSADGRELATAVRDGTAWVWDAANGTEIASVGHDSPAYDAGFSPNGALLVTAGGDGTARIWVIDQQTVLQDACTALPRNLTVDEWHRYLPEDPYRQTCPDVAIE